MGTVIQFDGAENSGCIPVHDYVIDVLAGNFPELAHPGPFAEVVFWSQNVCNTDFAKNKQFRRYGLNQVMQETLFSRCKKSIEPVIPRSSEQYGENPAQDDCQHRKDQEYPPVGELFRHEKKRAEARQVGRIG